MIELNAKSLVVIAMVLAFAVGVCAWIATQPTKPKAVIYQPAPVRTKSAKKLNIYVSPTKTPPPAKVITITEVMRGPKPETGILDGECPIIDKFLKSVANDYNSVEVVDCTSVYEWRDNAWAQRVRFRAKNGFGAKVINDWVFIMRNGSVIDVIQ